MVSMALDRLYSSNRFWLVCLHHGGIVIKDLLLCEKLVCRACFQSSFKAIFLFLFSLGSPPIIKCLYSIFLINPLVCLISSTIFQSVSDCSLVISFIALAKMSKHFRLGALRVMVMGSSSCGSSSDGDISASDSILFSSWSISDMSDLGFLGGLGLNCCLIDYFEVFWYSTAWWFVELNNAYEFIIYL